MTCAGFSSHWLAKNMQYTCKRCTPPPTSSLPLVDTPPPVGNRIVVQENADDTLPAMEDSFTVSPPPSTVHASSPRRNVVHHSPDHAHLASHRPDPQPAPSDQLPFSTEDLFSTRVATLRHIPKTAQKEMASLKNAVWNDVLCDPENLNAWTVALAHTKLTLFLPPGKKSFPQKSKVVGERIRAFKEGRLHKLWLQATKRPSRILRVASSPPTPSNNVKRATMLAQEGQAGRAAKALVSQGLDFDSATAINNMQALHPQSPPPPPLPPPPAAPYSFTDTEVMEALNSFHSTSAGGPSGERPAHIQKTVNADRSNNFLPTLTRLINLLAAGKAPAAVTPYICGGNLFAALKKSGGHRPIAVGESLRRLTAKCVTRKATNDAKESLAPHQLGVGVKGGAEAIIHAVNAVFHDDNIADEEKWVLQVDFSNAFNGISREEMQVRVREYCPKAAAWTESCYSTASHLFFNQTKISSSTGGDFRINEFILFYSVVASSRLLFHSLVGIWV